jgi:hypothetical protein
MRVMEKVIRNVAEIDSADRRAIEHLIGKHLAEHQQVIISVVNVDLTRPVESPLPAAEEVPDWWKVYEGLNDEDVDRLDQAIRQRANLTRVFE